MILGKFRRIEYPYYLYCLTELRLYYGQMTV